MFGLGWLVLFKYWVGSQYILYMNTLRHTHTHIHTGTERQTDTAVTEAALVATDSGVWHCLLEHTIILARATNINAFHLGSLSDESAVKFFAVFFSFSLSHTHTHTHTHGYCLSCTKNKSNFMGVRGCEEYSIENTLGPSFFYNSKAKLP